MKLTGAELASTLSNIERLPTQDLGTGFNPLMVAAATPQAPKPTAATRFDLN